MPPAEPTAVLNLGDACLQRKMTLPGATLVLIRYSLPLELVFRFLEPPCISTAAITRLTTSMDEYHARPVNATPSNRAVQWVVALALRRHQPHIPAKFRVNVGVLLSFLFHLHGHTKNTRSIFSIVNHHETMPPARGLDPQPLSPSACLSLTYTPYYFVAGSEECT